MKRIASLLPVLMLVGCASDSNRPEAREKDRAENMAAIEETREFLRTSNAETVLSIRYEPPLDWEFSNNQFVMVNTKDGKYLIEVDRYCPSLTDKFAATDVVTRRAMTESLRVNVDQLRGCRIATIYKLASETPEQ